MMSPKKFKVFDPRTMPVQSPPLTVDVTSATTPIGYLYEISPTSIRTPPPDKSMMELEEFNQPPPLMPQKSRRISREGSELFDQDFEEILWMSGEYDPISGSPCALGADGRCLSLGVLDLSSHSDTQFDNFSSSALSAESVSERVERDFTIHSPKFDAHLASSGPMSRSDISPDDAGKSSAARVGLNASQLSNMETAQALRMRPVGMSPTRECSPLHPQRLFNGENLFPDPDGDAAATAAAAGPAVRPRYGSPSIRQHPFHRPALGTAAAAATCRPPPTRAGLQEFTGLHEIGRGFTGRVFRGTRKIDLCDYAIKEIPNRQHGPYKRERVLREIFALAAQGDNVHVVRYYNSWEQDDHVYIQMELCTGTLSQRRRREGPLAEPALLDLLAQVSAGLAFMHAHRLAHLDVKPDNIYTTDRGIYKLGDLGLALHARGSGSEVEPEEGDRRYLCREILAASDGVDGGGEGCHVDLFKVDVFALGASAYETAAAAPLPDGGEAYQDFRDGQVPPLDGICLAVQALLRTMLHPDPTARPSAAAMVRHPLLYPLLRNESAACLRAVPPTEDGMTANGGGVARAAAARREEEQMFATLSRALQAEKEVARLKAMLAEAQAQVEHLRAKSLLAASSSSSSSASSDSSSAMGGRTAASRLRSLPPAVAMAMER